MNKETPIEMNKETPIEMNDHLFNMLYIDIITKNINKYIMALLILYINFVFTKKKSVEEIEMEIISMHAESTADYTFLFWKILDINFTSDECKNYMMLFKTKYKYEENEQEIIEKILENSKNVGICNVINAKIKELNHILNSFTFPREGIWNVDFPYLDFENELKKHDLIDKFSAFLNKYTLNYGVIVSSHENIKDSILNTFKLVVQKQIKRLEYLKKALDLK